MLNGARVLIAEDEPFIAFSLAACVEDAGGEVIGPCASVAEALSHIQSGALPTAAILDLNLMDGEVTPVAEQLLDGSVVVILHTGVDPPARLRKRAPALIYCAKPTAPERLVQTLGRVLEERRRASSPPT